MQITRASLAHQSDAQALLNEYYEAVGVVVRDSPEATRVSLADPAFALWIAYVNHHPAGCVVLRPLPSVPRASECKRLYVRPSFRGQGIADALLDSLENHAGLANSEWVYLDSKDDLKDALRLYLKRGYQPCERYNDNPQATVFLRKALLTSS